MPEVDNTMNIYASAGTKVTTNLKLMENGYESDSRYAKAYLKPDKVYTVKRTVVHSCRTEVYLEEFPDIVFNSVNLIEI